MTYTFPRPEYGDYADDDGDTRGTIEQVEQAATVYRLHPEFWRRFRALMFAAADAGLDLGVGTGWRVQPNPPPPGFAKPGNSNHEGFPCTQIPAKWSINGAVAIDMIDGLDSAAAVTTWVDQNALRFGLRTFKRGGVSNPGYSGTNEPWHIQPAEIPNSRRWRTEPWHLERFASLPGENSNFTTTGAPLMIELLRVDGTYALFVALTVNGVADTVRWLPSATVANAYRAAGVKERVITLPQLKNVALLGPLPSGDLRAWSPSDFALQVA